MIAASEGARELWQYRELFLFMVWRDIKVRYKQSALGAAWAILQPFLTMVVFTFLFGKMADIPSDGIPKPVFYYSALLPWLYFSGAINKSGQSLVANSNLLTKVYFPRVTIPASSVMGGLVDFAIASVILAGMMVYYQFVPTLELLLWPLLVVLLVALAFGVGMIFAAVNVRYRDVQYALPFCVQLLMFLSPVIYPANIISEDWQFLFALNPLTGIIEAFRASLVPSTTVDWKLLGIAAGMTVLILAVSTVYFKRTERSFADII